MKGIGAEPIPEGGGYQAVAAKQVPAVGLEPARQPAQGDGTGCSISNLDASTANTCLISPSNAKPIMPVTPVARMSWSAICLNVCIDENQARLHAFQ